MSATRLLEIREALAALAQSEVDYSDEVDRLRRQEEELVVLLGPEGTSLVGYPTDYPF